MTALKSPNAIADMPAREPRLAEEFRRYLVDKGYDPDDQFTDRYVEYELGNARHYFEAYGSVANLRGLELGSNFGASSIVLTLLGAEVDAVDVDPGLVEIARRNALSYVGAQARFHYVGDTRRLDWPNETFDFVCCNSVLEYVDPGHLPGVLAELDRVLKPGGRIYIIGTSNRLWPVEVHSRGVLTNYLPRSLARRIRPPRGVQQGTFYWSMRRHLRGYRNLDAVQRNRPYLRAKRQTMDRSWRYYVLVAGSWVLGRLGIAAGTLTPSINAVLEKPRQAAR